MKIFYSVVLFVLFSPTMTYKLENITIKTTAKQKCEKTNCPLMDDLVCVKINNKNKKEVYVIAKNKCEIIYASCQKDIDAVVVPMVNCQDVQNITSKRNKRDADESSGENITDDNADGQSGDDENGDQELLKDQSGEDENEDQELLYGQSRDDENEDQELVKGQSEDDENEDAELLKGQLEDDENEDQLKGLSDENEGIKAVLVPLIPANQSHSELNAKNSENSNKLEKKSHLAKVEAKTASDIDEKDVPNVIPVDNVGADYDLHFEKVNLVESKKDCPTVCPMGDVMVCARCQHNIYRTFFSLCHLRKFACKHTSERLELVKREPCVQSAPYISAFKETKGRIRGSGELDEVHKFIFCRDKKLLNKDDPRCMVVEEDK